MERFEIKLFLQSSCFAHLEDAIKLYDNMIKKAPDNAKFDIESSEGQRACAEFLKSVQKLWVAMNIPRADRAYIDRFSKAYKILYKEDNTIYLPEIFDSAQEGYSYLWVNGEKYVFSDDVLSSGKQLNDAFHNLKSELEYFETQFKYRIESNAHFKEVKQDLNAFLESFDRIWTSYEKNYILELMVIEADSRRYIQNAIDAEKELCLAENSLLNKTNTPTTNKIKETKSNLIELICKINSVANISGKGRDDLGYEILEAAEKRKKEVCSLKSWSPSEIRSPFIRLYENIHLTLTNIRLLLTKYSENIEVVDPQLKNNSELVEAITDFESVWSKGKMYLLEDTKFNCFIALSQYIEYLTSTYSQFKQQVDERDYEIFMIIPSLILQNWVFEILKHNITSNGKLNTEVVPRIVLGANWTNIIHAFCPSMISAKDSQYDLSPELSKIVLWMYSIQKSYQENSEIDISELQKTVFEPGIINDNLLDLLRKSISSSEWEGISGLKPLGIELQRAKPSEWNELLDICIQDS